jgi:hypothetical protein
MTCGRDASAQGPLNVRRLGLEHVQYQQRNTTVRRRLILLVVLTASLFVPAVAQAHVLITEPQHALTTSGCITMGFWYQSYSGGPRTVKVAVYYKGHRKAYRQIRATTRGRDYVLACPGYPNAGNWYTRVTGAGWSETFRTRVRVDGD